MLTANLERVELEIEIRAPVERVWQALMEETDFWWHKDFYVNPKAQRFHIEPRLGGRMLEDWGNDSGVVWYEIFAFDPPRSVDFRGSLAVPFGPALSLLHLELQAVGESTRLMLSDSTFGVSTDDGKSKRDGWTQLFEDGLKNYVEKQPSAKI